MSYITRSSAIRHQKIYSNGEIIFQTELPSLDAFLSESYDNFKPGYPKFYKMDRLSQLGFLAGEILLKDSLIKTYQPESVALILSNAHSSLDTDIRFQESTKVAASPALFVYTLPNIVAGEICIRHGIKGENAFFVTPDFDPLMLANYSEQVLAQPGVQACVAGWIDVMNGHHDVLLYLIEKQSSGLGLAHTSKVLRTLYQQHGKVDGRS